MQKINIPLTVPKFKEKEFIRNYKTATQGSDSLMLFPGDQKIEHLNKDFVGKGIPAEVADPEHFFRIASKAKIGVFGSQIGLIAQYGRDYPHIPYLIKLNAKTNLVEADNDDAMSNALVDISQVIEFKKQSKLNIVGVGYTIYIGSKYESIMMRQVSQVIYNAHKNGLIVVLWMYPRGKSIKNEKDIHLIAGGAGVASCLGADFVKCSYPYSKSAKKDAENYQEVIAAAGRCGVICVGGAKKGTKEFLKNLYLQKTIAGSRGNAIARNIYQRPLDEAIRMANAVTAICVYGKDPEFAYDVFLGNKKL